MIRLTSWRASLGILFPHSQEIFSSIGFSAFLIVSCYFHVDLIKTADQLSFVLHTDQLIVCWCFQVKVIKAADQQLFGLHKDQLILCCYLQV